MFLKDENCKTLFFCNLNEEEFWIFNQKYRFPIGMMTQIISDSNEVFWEKCLDISNDLSNMCQIYIQDEGFGYKQLCELFDVVKRIRELEAPEILKELVILLPAQHGCFSYEREKERIELTYKELQHNMELLESNDFSTDNKESFYRSIDKMTPYYENISLWKNLIHVLRLDDYLKVMELYIGHYQNSKKILATFLKYIINLKLIVEEGIRLKQKLSCNNLLALEKCKVANLPGDIEELAIILEGPVMLSRKQKEKYFSDRCNDKKGLFYSVYTLSMIIHLELYILSKNDMYLKRCKLCGKYYMTSKSNSIYCNYLNEKYGKPCKEIAAQIVFLEKSSLMYKKYKKNYEAYNRWLNRVKKNKELLLEILCVYEREVELECKCRSQVNRKIIEDEAERRVEVFKSEITKTFNDWSYIAGESVKEYDSKLIEEDICLKRIEIPTVEERSKELVRLKEVIKKSRDSNIYSKNN